MAFITHITNERGEKIGSLLTAFDKYLLPDGTQCFVSTVPAWCCHCRAFVLAEELPEPDTLIARARSVYERRSAAPLFPLAEMDGVARAVNEGLLQQFLHEAEQWRIALRARDSLPRCLECGHCEYIEIPEEGEWFEHPEIPAGRVRAITVMHASMGSSGRLYDTNGWKLAK